MVVDGHNDVPWKLRSEGRKLEGFSFERLSDAERAVWHTDLERLKAGGVGGQFWSVYVPPELGKDEAVTATLEQIDIARRLIARHPAHLTPARTAADIKRAMSRGQIASMLGAEGGHSIGNSMGVLRQLHALGVGYMTLTHAKTTDWADSANDVQRHGGLAPFGVQVVKEMNRLGMLIDLSHVSPETMHDALDVSAAPVIFSHSNAYSVTPNLRNVPDPVLKRLPSNGGLVMVTFVPQFSSSAFFEWLDKQTAEDTRLKALYPQDASKAAAALEIWQAANPKPRVTARHVADHIDHIRRVAGIDHIGLGADLDGTAYLPEDLKTAASYPRLFAELTRRGYSRSDLEKLANGNILRAMKRAEAAAARLQRESRPSEARMP
jgi:membrane dipeptidase